MNFFQNIKNFFSSEKKSNELDLMNPLGWQNALNWQRRGFTSFTNETAQSAYAAHELVFACIQKTADVMNDAEIVVEKINSKGDWEKVSGHPLTSLFKRPNSHETGKDFRRLQVQSELSSGIFYAEIIRSRAGLPVEIFVLNPTRILPVLDYSQNEISYYQYTRGNGTIKQIAPENMLIRRRVDLTNRFYGLSPLKVALKSINSDLGLTDYVDAFFTNDGTPSGILKVLNASLNEAQKKAVSAEWKNKYGRGSSNQNGIAVLDQNMNFENIGSKINELETDQLSGRFESRICSVFGVPPILVGAYVGLIHTTNNATLKAALNDFWDNKISPELATLREWLTWFLLPEFEDINLIKAEKVRVNYDLSQCKWLMDDVDAIHDRNRKDYQSDGITKNEFRAAIGKEPIAGGDKFRSDYIAAKTAPKELPKETEKPKQLPAPEEKTEGLEKKTLKYWRELSDIEKIIDLKSLEADLEKESKSLEEIILILRKDLISQSVKETARLSLENISDISLTISNKNQKLLEKLLEQAVKTGANQVLQELSAQNSSKSFEQKDGSGFDIKTLLELIMARIIFEIKTRAINVAVLLYTLGIYSEEEMLKRLEEESQKQFENWAKNFANLAIQAGREKELKRADVKYYEYSAILDGKVCKPCKKWDGKQSEILKNLPKVPYKKCLGLWNCRCFIVAVAKSET